MEEIILTVIIPVYKVEEYIDACLSSLLRSGEDDRTLPMEVLVINDGTPDGSADVARRYQAKFPSVVKVIDKENGGHGSAWNVGLAMARGRYILFLDSDDMVAAPGRLLDFLKKTDADLVLTDKMEFMDGTTRAWKVRKSFPPAGKVIDLDSEPWPYDLKFPHFHTCVYKRGLLEPVFSEKTSYDDILLFGLPAAKARTCVYAGFPLYIYRLGRPGQTMDKAVLQAGMEKQIAQRKYMLRSVSGFAGDAGGAVSAAKAALVKSIVKDSCKAQYYYIAGLPEPLRSRLTGQWTEYVRDNVPYWKEIAEVRLWGGKPYAVYRMLLKIRNLFIKLKRATKGV